MPTVSGSSDRGNRSRAPHPPNLTSPTRRVLFAAFFLTGAAGLLFEVVWTRLLLLEFGATSLAVAAVLAAFMGGMAVGSALGPTILRSGRDPVLVYAVLEGWAGLYGLATPWLLAQVGGPTALRFGLSLLALLPATAAMGASLPILTRALNHNGGSGAALVGRLYAANTAGAVAGPLLAAFVLMPGLGLSGALHAAAVCDLLVGIGIFALRMPRTPQAPAEPARTRAQAAAPFARPPLTLLLVLAVSGGTAMVYEVAWSRTLSLVFGSSVYGVSVMLSTFLAGLAAGSALAARVVRGRALAPAVHVCAWLLAGSALAAFVSVFVAKGLPVTFLDIYRSLPGGDVSLLLSQSAAAALLMLPATLCLGALLPVAVAALPHADEHLGCSVAWLYTANLAGSTLGTLLAAGLMMGSLGIEFSVRAASMAALLLSLPLFFRAPVRPLGLLACFAGVVLVPGIDPSWEPAAKSFGLYSDPESFGRYGKKELERVVASYRPVYYRDGHTATVSVQEVAQYTLLKINGKTDASDGPGDLRTQLLLGHLPLMAAPAQRVAVVGWGSGMTVGAVLTHPVGSVDAFEIEPAVVEASRYFEPGNGTPMADARVRLVLGDARAQLARRGPYDLIISEPSNPWLTGVANLFTADFFRILAARLAEGGLVCQWFHLYGMSEDATRSLLATFRSVFPHTLVFGERDLILLGSQRPLRFERAHMQARFESVPVQRSLQRIKVQHPFDLLVDLRLDESGAEAFARGAGLNTDDNMALELMAPRTLYSDRREAILAAMRTHPPALASSLAGYGGEGEVDLERAASLFTRGLNQEALLACQRSLARQASFDGKKLLGQILAELGRREEARAALREALTLPAGAEARGFVEALVGTLDAPRALKE